uniref:IMS import disulfide relay-system CHCH-CHCH-like Cx9C domain-containing protein n=1 Tax=Solanum tuberosum TaxID=4113 RepID=M1CZ38_SOLTU
MGRKAGTLFINPKNFGSLQKPCVKDMVTFLNCLTLNHNKDDKCSRQKSLLSACMEAQVCIYSQTLFTLYSSLLFRKKKWFYSFACHK